MSSGVKLEVTPAKEAGTVPNPQQGQNTHFDSPRRDPSLPQDGVPRGAGAEARAGGDSRSS